MRDVFLIKITIYKLDIKMIYMVFPPVVETRFEA